MWSVRRFGRRYLILAFCSSILLIHTLYSLYSRAEPPSTSLTEPEASLDSPAGSLAQELPAIIASTREHSTCSLTKVSMLYGSHKFSQLEAALESHRRHCERWGCGYECLEQDLTGRKLYSKHYFVLSTILHELSKPALERKQWVMWVDADSIVVNPAISPCAFLPPDGLSNIFALVTADHQGLNNGIFFLRVHQSSVDLLTQMVDYPLAHPDEDLGWFGEQRAMELVIHSTEAQLKVEGSPPGIAWIPREWVNAFQWEHGFEGQPGHLMVHFAGLAETRLQHMQNWLDELQRDQAKWEIPLEKTFYADVVPKYWDELAANTTRRG